MLCLNGKKDEGIPHILQTIIIKQLYFYLLFLLANCVGSLWGRK